MNVTAKLLFIFARYYDYKYIYKIKIYKFVLKKNYKVVYSINQVFLFEL